MNDFKIGDEYLVAVSNASMNKYSKLKKQIAEQIFKCPCSIKTGEKVTITDIIDDFFVLVRFRNYITVVAKNDLIK